MEINSVVKTGLFKAMAVLIPESESDAAMDELKLYRDAEGTFGIKSAISRRATMQPRGGEQGEENRDEDDVNGSDDDIDIEVGDD
ncbi:hypothetical protein IFM89_032555 [Coptis chinensis]|uniref:Uncharacterized protein n=1 Tax=Coptis chinensis TaxID=261450 RepID=A0A835I6V4_9MAGN|nr:hypothetical protein IFM89_032555 [Coptis chinensis]